MGKDPEAGKRALKHGVYSKKAIQIHGEDLGTRPAVVLALQEQALRALQASKIITSYVARKVNEGVDLDSIPSVRALPAFQNSAVRALVALHNMLPPEQGVIDVGEMLKSYDKDQEGESEQDEI